MEERKGGTSGGGLPAGNDEQHAPTFTWMIEFEKKTGALPMKSKETNQSNSFAFVHHGSWVRTGLG